MTSSFNLSFKKWSTISDSLIGTENLKTSSREVIFPALTNLPNLVTGFQSNSPVFGFLGAGLFPFAPNPLFSP